MLIPSNSCVHAREIKYAFVMTLRSYVCFDTWFLRVSYGVRWTQPACLLGAVEFSDTRSSPVEASRHSNSSKTSVQLTNFAEFGFQNGLEMAYFSPFLTKLL